MAAPVKDIRPASLYDRLLTNIKPNASCGRVGYLSNQTCISLRPRFQGEGTHHFNILSKLILLFCLTRCFLQTNRVDAYSQLGGGAASYSGRLTGQFQSGTKRPMRRVRQQRNEILLGSGELNTSAHVLVCPDSIHESRLLGEEWIIAGTNLVD
ncbi:hypothetical protein BDR05DRAFT_957520 [Suillus weaverae]|nr:hypothetical protein BDR05DRAFT_957520 [Suillus weaverae]